MTLRKLLLLTATCVVGCIAAISKEELAANAAKGLRLISLAPDVDPVWLTEDEKLELIRSDRGFFDVTETYDPEEEFHAFNAKVGVQATYPPIKHGVLIDSLLRNVSLSNMQANLDTLTAFNNRYYRSTTGAQAALFIRDTAQQYATAFFASNATVRTFNHSFVQNSVIARIPGTTSDTAVTILGAHLDSINSGNPTSGRAPGADDDGSGSVNLLEAFRTLIAAGYKPLSPIEFHWYAGEEGGLLGSQDIAKSYKNAGVQVKAMLQLDMTAYVKPGTTPTIGLIADYTDSGLNNYLGSLVSHYLTVPWLITSACGYGCSDHASWNRQGYPATFPFEATFANQNTRIHTTGDTTAVAGFDWNHSLNYAKLAVAYAYELGGS